MTAWLSSARAALCSIWFSEITVPAGLALGRDNRPRRWCRKWRVIAGPTPEVYAAIAEVERLRKIAKTAEDAVKAAVRAIPRISEDDVAGLIRAATEKHEV